MFGSCVCCTEYLQLIYSALAKDVGLGCIPRKTYVQETYVGQLAS